MVWETAVVQLTVIELIMYKTKSTVVLYNTRYTIYIIIHAYAIHCLSFIAYQITIIIIVQVLLILM